MILWVILLMISAPALSLANDEPMRWQLIVKSDSGNDYYIAQDTLIYTEYNTARAWYKIVPSKRSSIFEKIKNLRFFGVKMSDADYYKLYAEVDCTKKAMKFLITTAYNQKGEILRRDETLDTKWIGIPNQSSFDMIRSIVCGIT